MILFHLTTITMLFYLLATLVQGVSLATGVVSNRRWMWMFALIAVSAHGILLHRWIDVQAGQNLAVLNMLSLIIWLIAVLLLIVMLLRSVELLALFVFPAASISIVLVIMFPHRFIVQTAANPSALIHILLSVMTFSVLCLAGLLALLLAFQERALRDKRIGWMMRWVPPLATLEQLLFQVIIVGFILLSVVLISSFYIYHDLLWQHVVLVQKAILAILAWFIFAGLLLGRLCWRWRGNRVTYWALIGVILLLVAYFGSKWVLQILVSTSH